MKGKKKVPAKKKPAKKKPAPVPKHKLRGAARMREFGYHLVNVWLDGAEDEHVKQAAKIQDVPVSTFVRRAAAAAAAALIQAEGPKPTADKGKSKN